MKKIKDYIQAFRTNFKRYRKKKGGIWYYVYEPNGFNTFDGANSYWTQQPKADLEILKVEKYS
jgi:hypothetical protein